MMHHLSRALRTIGVVGSLIFGLSHSANAGVVYNWENLTLGTDQFAPFIGRLEITQEAHRAGSLSYFYGDFPRAVVQDPTSPVLLLAFGFGTSEGGPDATFINRYRTGSTGAEDSRETKVDVMFETLLEGGISSGGNEISVRMGSDASGIWTVSEMIVGQEAPGRFDYCRFTCPGGTGRWVLDASTVPTPGSLALVSLALVLLGAGASRSASSGLRESR